MALPRAIRSVGAVLGGYVAMVLLTMGLTVGMSQWVPESFDQEGLTYVPPWNHVMVACGFLFAVVAGFVTGVIARTAELAHALGLAALAFVMWIVYFLTSPDAVSSTYQVSLQVVGVLGILIGGGLRAIQSSRRRQA